MAMCPEIQGWDKTNIKQSGIFSIETNVFYIEIPQGVLLH